MAIFAGKRKIISALESELREEATLQEAVDYLLYLAGIEEGLADVDAGRTISHEEMLERIKQWTTK
jgi:predicted transcriptional regulator